MKKITLTLFLIVFALNIGQAQKKLSDVIGIQSTSNKTTTSQVVTDEMLGKKSSQIAREAELQVTSEIDIENLLIKYSSLGNQTGDVSAFFTQSEMEQLRAYLGSQNGTSKRGAYMGFDARGGESTAYGIENAGLGYGSFDPTNPAVFTTISGGSGTGGFEGAGAISPSDPTLGYVMDSNGILYQLNTVTGVYTNLGNTGIAQVNGMAFNPVNGTLYAITGTSLYTVNPAGPSLTLVGNHNIPSTFAIALGITDAGAAYTYDIGLDQLFSVNLTTGAATLIGSIGFDANFGQGMDWDSSTGTMYMAAFNVGIFDTEIRSVNLTTGATTLIGVLVPGPLTQMGWVSFLGAGGGGGTNPCSFTNPSNSFENGTPNSLYGTANDLLVTADETFTLEQIIINTMSPPGSTILFADLTYYTNSGSNLPGTTIGSQLNVIPTSQTIIGSAFGFDVRQVILDVTPFDFSAGASDTTFWIQIHSPNSAGTASYWEATTATTVGNLAAGFDGATWTFPAGWAGLDGVYEFIGECTGGGGGGGGECEWVVNVSGSGWGDEVSWELRDNTNTVILSGGSYGLGYNDTQTVMSDNGPMTFYIEAIGPFNDNTPAYTVTANGDVVAAGTLAGGTDATHSGLECEGGGGGDCEPGIIELPFDASFNEFAGNMFDVTAIGGEDVEIEGFDVNIDPGTALISVYYREGSYVGFENSSAGWTLMGSETVTSAGENMPTYVDVGGLIIPDGDTYGIYVTVTDYPSTNMNYTNGNNSFSDTYLQVNTGIGKGNPDFTGATFLERSWNGTIHYCAGEGGGGEPGDCETGTFSSRAAFEAAFSGTLNLEDFAGGPGDLVGCDGPFNSGGNSCFPAGAILPGISITTSTPSEPDPTVFLPAGMFGNTIDMVGSNQFASYTIIEFPNNDVSAFGFDLIALLGGGNVQVRIFGTGGLIETLSVNASSQVFFGYISSEIITSVELEDLTLANVELIGMLAFGLCEGGGDPGDCVETNVGAGDTDDGLNCAINGTFGAANDITVPAGYNFVLTEITANILSNGDITLVNVLYYDDNSGLPGAQIGSEMGITSPLTSDNIIGNAFGFDIHEIVFDVTQFTFSGDEDNAMTYWIELEIDNTAGAGGIYWEVTSDNMVGNPTALWQGAWGIWDPNFDGVYTWTGDCELIPVSIEENTITGFTFYPNPAVDIIYLQADATIDSVELYNVLGQKVISQQIGSNTSQVDVSGLSVGTYLMTVTSEGVMSTHKVVKK